MPAPCSFLTPGAQIKVIGWPLRKAVANERISEATVNLVADRNPLLHGEHEGLRVLLRNGTINRRQVFPLEGLELSRVFGPRGCSHPKESPAFLEFVAAELP